MSIVNSIIQTQELATLPPIATKVLMMLEDDNIDMRTLAQVIETDASMSLKLLRVANSPLYATKTHINSINQALLILGLNRLTNIVLGVSIFSKFLVASQKLEMKLMEKFWWHSSCTGIVAKALTSKLRLNFKELEFIGGLLHDIGKMAMMQYDPAKFKKVVELIEEKEITDIIAEREIFGTDHAEVGEQIAKLWKLPEDLIFVISNHNSPEQIPEYKELISVVRFSDLLCEIWGADIHEGYKVVDFNNEECWMILKSSYPELQNLDMEKFTFELEEEYKKSSEFLNFLKD